MKTQQTRYRQPGLEEEVARRLEAIGKQVAINAETAGSSNYPPPQCRDLRPYFEEDHSKYQALLDEVNRQLQFQATCEGVKEHRQATDSNLRGLRNAQSANKERQLELDGHLREKKEQFGRLRLPLIWGATAALCLFDGMLAIPTFEAWAYGFGVAAAIGLLYAVVLALISHLFERITSLGGTPLRRRAIALGTLLLLTLLFYAMARRRTDALEQEMYESTQQAAHFSPWPFTLISLLLVGTAIALHYFYFPSHQQRADNREYLALKKVADENRAELQRLKKQEEAIEAEHAEFRQLSASLLEYGAALEDFIVTAAKGGYALYKKQNMIVRRDGLRPVVFDVTGYPFKFRTNFHLVNKFSNHED